MHPTTKAARTAGLLYLGVVLTGPFVLLYVPGKLFVPGNATATADNILAHQALFQAHIAVGLVSELLFVAVAFALYRLLKEVSVPLAVAMVLLVVIEAPLAFLGSANEVATLSFLRNPGFLAVFDKPQRDALTMMFMTYDAKGVMVAELFWGLWLIPLGVLVYRSGFIPRFLGVWLFINGLAYVALSAMRLPWPHHATVAITYATPVLMGEVVFMLWLVIVGARVRPAALEVSAAP